MKAAIPVNGQSTALGMAVRKVRVEQVVPERGVAIVSDKTNKTTEIPYRVQQGRGRLPKIGDTWYVDRTLGPWMFLYFVAAADEDFKTFDDGILIPTGGQLRIGAVNASNTAAIAVRRPLVTDAIEAYGVDGDSSSRFVTTADGGMSWGPGGVSARDTFLYRTGPGTLTTDGSIIVNGIGQIREKVQAADQLINNQATFQNATDLFLSVAANCVYRVEVWAHFSSTATPLGANTFVKMDWNVPAGTIGPVHRIGATNTTAAYTSPTNHAMNTGIVPDLSSSRAYQMSLGPQGFYEMGIMTVGATAGTWRLRFAQNTASVANLILLQNSSVRMTRLS